MTKLDSEILALMRRVSDAVILPRYKNLRPGEVDDKGGNEPVTIADREAEAMLSDALSKLEPSMHIVGEEAAFANETLLEALGQECWIVDPIDGTRNFARGAPPFGIIIAWAESGVTKSGWIYDCLSGRFCAAHMGKGAFVDGQRISASPTGQQPPIAAISVLFADDDRRKALLEDVAPHYQLVDIPYCAAEQYPRLALGANDISIFERTLAWDHAAGALWLNEAGGKVARPDGSPYLVNEPTRTGLLAAASNVLWESLANRVGKLP